MVSNSPPSEGLNIYYITNQLNLLDFKEATLKECIEYLNSIQEIGLDTETSGLNPYNDKVLLVQVGDENRQYVIDTTTIDISPLKPILEDPNKVKLLWNAKFDYSFLRALNITIDNIYDGQIAEMVLTTGLNTSVSLANACKNYLNLTLQKDTQKEFINKRNGKFTVKQIEYGAKDILYLFEIKRLQQEKLKYFDLFKTLSLELEFVKVLADIEYNGFYLDRNMWLEVYKKNILRLEESLIKLDSYVIENNHEDFIENQLDLFSSDKKCTIKWSSAKQVIPYLKFLGIDTKVTEKGVTKDTSDSKHLFKYKKDFPFIAMYLNYKQIAKEVSTYGEDFLKNINTSTNRVHSSYWQVISSGRMSSRNPNLQNIPSDAKYRGCFIAPKNKVLIVSDYAAQEQRVLADRCQDPALLEFYKSGDGDMHCVISRKVFKELEHLDTETIKTKHSDKRQFAKTIGFALNYGGSEHTIANSLQIPLSEAKEMVDNYFKGFPKMTSYFNEKEKETIYNGYVLIDSLTKRKSFLPFYKEFKELESLVKEEGFWEKYRENKELYRESVSKFFQFKGRIRRLSMNLPIQGTSGSMTKLALIYLRRKIKEYNLEEDVLIVNVIHDEIVIESSLQNKKLASKILEDSMVEAGKKFCKIVDMGAKAEVTNYWTH